jgi:hypothetical protein
VLSQTPNAQHPLRVGRIEWLLFSEPGSAI